MTSPGGGQEISSVFVSVVPSLAGIASQMQSEGAQAAQQFSESFRQGTAARFGSIGAEHAQQYATGFKQNVQTGAASPFEQMLPVWTAQFSSAGKQASAEWRKQVQSEMGSPFTSNFDQHFNQWRSQFSSAGRQAASAWRQEVQAGLRPIGAEAQFAQMVPQWTATFGNAGRQASQAMAESFGSTVKTGLPTALMELVPALRPFANLMGGMGADHGAMYAKALKEETAKLPGNLLPTWENINANMGAQAAKAGAASGALMKAGMVGAIIAGVEQVKENIENVIHFYEEEIKQFAKVGADAAHVMTDSFVDVVHGKMPDFMAAFNVVEEGVQTAFNVPFNEMNLAIDNTVGHIPILGSTIKSVAGEMQGAFNAIFVGFDQVKSIATEIMGTFIDVGNTWEETARTIAGQTISTGGLEQSLGVVRDIAASGALVHFQDIGEVVGELGQRLSDLGNGVGISREQLTELATTLAEGNELLGNIHINVDNLTAAFNDFGVAPEQANQSLTTLINISRLTGANINTMLTDIDTVAPSLENMGYGLDTTAYMMGKLNQELGGPAMHRLAYGLAQVEDKLHLAGFDDTKKGWADIIEMVKQYVAEGDHAAAVDFLKGFVGSSRTAQTLVDGIIKNIVQSPDDVQRAMDENGDALTQPLDNALESTKTLSDTMEQIGNQMMAALAPLGMGLVEKLREAGNHVSDWLKENQGKVLSWATTAAVEILKGAGWLAGGLATMISDVEPVIQGIIKGISLAMLDVLGPIDKVMQAMASVPGGKLLMGPAAALVDPLHDTVKTLNDASNIDLSKLTDPVLKALTDVKDKYIPDIVSSLDKGSLKIQDSLAIDKATRATFKLGDETEPTEHSGIKMDKEGHLQLQGDLDAQKKLLDQLHQLGIDFTLGDKGLIKGITAHSQAEADAFQDWLKEQFPGTGGQPKVQIELGIKTANSLLTAEDIQRGLGLPGELIGQDGVKLPVQPDFIGGGGSFGSPPGPPPPPGTLPPGVPDNGLPGPGGLFGPAIPGTVNLDPNAPEMPKEGVMGAAGIPPSYQGDVPHHSPGVVFPATTQLEEDPPKKTVQELMDGMGIPAEMQGDEGITMPVSFQMSGMGSSPLSGSSSLFGPIGAPSDNVNPSDKNAVASYILQAAMSRGYSQQDATAILAYAIGESGLNPTNSGGPQGGPGDANTVIGLFQEKPDFARSAGVDPALRNTVAGNVTAYLNTLAQHRNEPIEQALPDTSVGGPLSPAGRQDWAGLLRQAQAYINALGPLADIPAMSKGGAVGGKWFGATPRSMASHMPSTETISSHFAKAFAVGGLVGFDGGGDVPPPPGPPHYPHGVPGDPDARVQPGDDATTRHLPPDDPVIAAAYAAVNQAYDTGSPPFLPALFDPPGQLIGGLARGRQFGPNGTLSSTTKSIRDIYQQHADWWANAGFEMPHFAAGGRVGYAAGGAADDFFADGDHWVRGSWWPGRDTVPANLPHNSYVIRRNQAQKHAGLLDSIAQGHGNHGVSRHIKAALEVGERVMPPTLARYRPLFDAINYGYRGFLTGGSADGPWGSANAAANNPTDDSQGVIPEILGAEAIAHQYGLRLTAGRSGHGTHQVDGGYHDSGEAGDFSNGVGTPEEAAFATYMASNFGPEIAELIHTGPGWDPNYNIKDGKFIRDYGGVGKVYDQETLYEHRDHVHVAMRPGSSIQMEMLAQSAGMGQSQGFSGAQGFMGSSGAAPMSFGFGGANMPMSFGFGPGMPMSPGGGSPGNPQLPAPTMPGSNYADVGPPPNFPSVPADTPGAVQTPWGYFQYPWDMPDKGASLTPEQQQSYATWLNQYERRADTSADAQQRLNDLQSKTDDLKQAKDEADKKYDDLHKLLLSGAGDDPDKIKFAESNKDLVDAKSKAAAADRAYADNQSAISAAQKRIHEDDISQHIEDLKKPPWESTKAQKVTPDKNAEQLGQGLVKGIFQELGFPDVFGKPFTEWGIWKMAMGGAGYGLSLLQNMGSAQWGSAGQGSATSGPLGFAEGLFPGISKLLAPATQGTPSAPGMWQPAAATPTAMQPSQAPTAAANLMNAGRSGTLIVNQNNSGVMSPPDIKSTVQQHAHSTAAPQLSGGAGNPH